METGAEMKKDDTRQRTILIGGALLLTLSLVLLYSWLTLFFTMATSRGGNICWGTGCDEASWQADLGRTLSNSFSNTNAVIKPFLWVFHISLVIFLFRLVVRKDHTFLPMEFGILNIFWMLLGTALFSMAYIGHKATTPVPQYPISTPLTEAGTDGPMLVITGPPTPPSDGCVIASETGWTVFDPDDRRCIIASIIPGWLYGKQLAWSGMAASLFLALGLSISQATGWLNRWIGRRSKAMHRSILFTVSGLAVVLLLLEFYVFQSHLLW